jgi:hypothetical protein
LLGRLHGVSLAVVRRMRGRGRLAVNFACGLYDAVV